MNSHHDDRFDAALRPVALGQVGGLPRAPRRHHEIRQRAAVARDAVIVAAVDEFREQVVLVRRLEIDALAPRRIAQARALGLAVLHEALETVAHQPRDEAVPLGAVELVGGVAEAIDHVAGKPYLFAEVVPCPAR